MKRRQWRWCVALFAVALAGCNWGRFSELKKDAPVVRLSPPDFFEGGFADQLAATENEDGATLYVGGPGWSRGGMTFSLGLSESPSLYPHDTEHCLLDDGEVQCRALDQAAGLRRLHLPGDEDAQELCFVTGVARRGAQYGLYGKCEGGRSFLLPLPAGVDGAQLMNADEDDPTGTRVSSSAGTDQLLLASSAARSLAWFYPPGQDVPVLLPYPDEATSDLGRSLAVARVASGYLLVLGAPRQGALFVYRYDGESATTLGCLQGEEGFGRTLAAGDMDGDGADDVAVAATRSVTLLSGARLEDLSALDSGCAPEETLEQWRNSRIPCSPTVGVGGCGGSDFGVSLAIADLSGTGHGIVGIGAPKISVHNQARAGVVFAYDFAGQLRDVLRISDPQEDDLLGQSVVRVSQEGREIFAVGARRARFAYLFYCSNDAESVTSARCQ